MQFEGKTAFITGGGRGIGESFAKAPVGQGAAAVPADIDLPAAQKVAAEIIAGGGRALAVSCDVADEESVQHAVGSTVQHFGGIDILINNAGLHGFAYGQPITKLSLDKWRRLLDVNVVGIVICSAACRASMAARGGGVIINMSSIASMPATTAYGVSKLAVRGLTVGLAQEFAPDNIRVYALAPGTRSGRRDAVLLFRRRQLHHRRDARDRRRPPAAELGRICWRRPHKPIVIASAAKQSGLPGKWPWIASLRSQ